MSGVSELNAVEIWKVDYQDEDWLWYLLILSEGVIYSCETL